MLHFIYTTTIKHFTRTKVFNQSVDKHSICITVLKLQILARLGQDKNITKRLEILVE